jgi:hypothetical protein
VDGDDRQPRHGGLVLPERLRRPVARWSLPDNGFDPKHAPGVYSFTYGNVGVVALDANDVSYEIPANKGYTDGSRRSGWTAAAVSCGREGGRLRRGLLPPLRVLDVDARLGRRGAGRVAAAVRQAPGGPGDQRAQPRLRADRRHQGTARWAGRVPIGASTDPTRDGIVYVTAGGGGRICTASRRASRTATRGTSRPGVGRHRALDEGPAHRTRTPWSGRGCATPASPSSRWRRRAAARPGSRCRRWPERQAHRPLRGAARGVRPRRTPCGRGSRLVVVLLRLGPGSVAGLAAVVPAVEGALEGGGGVLAVGLARAGHVADSAAAVVSAMRIDSLIIPGVRKGITRRRRGRGATAAGVACTGSGSRPPFAWSSETFGSYKARTRTAHLSPQLLGLPTI